MSPVQCVLWLMLSITIHSDERTNKKDSKSGLCSRLWHLPRPVCGFGQNVPYHANSQLGRHKVPLRVKWCLWRVLSILHTWQNHPFWPSTAVTSVNQLPLCSGFLPCRHHHNPPFTGAGSWFPALNWHDFGQAGSVITRNQPNRWNCFSDWMLWESHTFPLCWHSSISSMLQDAGGVQVEFIPLRKERIQKNKEGNGSSSST